MAFGRSRRAFVDARKGKPKRCPVCRLRHPRPWCRRRAAVDAGAGERAVIEAVEQLREAVSAYDVARWIAALDD